VLSVDPTDAPIKWLDSDQVISVYCRSMSVPRLSIKSDRIHSKQLRVVVAAEAGEQASKHAVRAQLVCLCRFNSDLKTLCML
jgi:hypothetical protein